MVDWKDIVGNVLLFFLVFGMSATVDANALLLQLKNRKAIATGVFLQFVIMPLLGFIIVYSLNMPNAVGITLLVVTCSPGGSFSNWWCSMFNADLALSVTMTAISTLLGVFMLPANLMLYTRLSYEGNILEILNWWALFTAISIVIGGITLGLVCSAKFASHQFHLNANRIGNLCGISLVFFSAVLSNTEGESHMWDQDWTFYFGVMAPCLFGLLFANIFTSFLMLKKPERVTVSIECCYQNVGIATSVALTMFDGDELAAALGVPFFYGLVEAVLLGVYCIVAWKIGWTKAPKNVSIWTALSTSYEIAVQENKDGTLLEDQESSSNKLPTNVDEKEEGEDNNDDDDGFHYVKHEDAEPDEEAPKERMIDEPTPPPPSPPPPPVTTPQAETKGPLVAEAGSGDDS
mmetsp:Transcript_18353/g.33266  ORF Transcript_18353/g.33266 Transcript_18353/m.33266 type:complete len:405 (+) Transcript_18353:93-1307(+)